MKIRPVFNKIAKTSVGAFNEIGRTAIDSAHNVKNFITRNTSQNKDIFQSAKIAKENNFNKETVLGIAISTAVITLAIKCIKDIKHSIDSIKKEQ